MTTARHDDTAQLPLITDEDIQERVRTIIGRANQRQLWLLFLDEGGAQLPLLVPISALPTQPTDQQTAQVLDRVREVMDDIGADSLITVLERYATSALTASDVLWARSLGRACIASGVRLRAQLLSFRSGVRMIDAAELGDPEAA